MPKKNPESAQRGTRNIEPKSWATRALALYPIRREAGTVAPRPGARYPGPDRWPIRITHRLKMLDFSSFGTS